MANESLPAGAPSPRLCHLVKWPDHDEYGFNLHAEKAKLGQFIGTVDTGSPAYYAGLLEGDRIIEVNDVNISNENHRQVVERIKAIANETRLLVVDKQTDEWYKERKLIVKGTQKNVSYKKNPTERPEANNYTANNVKENGDSQKSNSSKESDSITSEAPAPRLCHLVKWPDFPDYGFNLISQDNGEEIVVNVDPDSPADLAGLKAGDRILEVNGVSVKAAGEVVIQIKASPGEVRLLVLNQVAEQWYRTRGLVPRSTQPNVIYGKTPAVRPSNGAAMNAKNNKELPAKSPAREPADDSKLPDDAPRPRLCQLYKWPDFEGYGFSLHAEQGRDGQYVGKVDPDSPAEFAGLLEGDRIVEVNGASVENEDHRQLVQRIKAMPNKARLLVVNPEGDRWYRERGLKPTSSQPNVIVMETPVPRPTDPTPTVETLHEEVTKKLEKARLEAATNQQPGGDSRSSTPQSTACTTGSAQESPRSIHSGHASPPPAAKELNLNMSVSEMRQMLAARKKYDPKKVQMDLRDKYNIIQEM